MRKLFLFAVLLVFCCMLVEGDVSQSYAKSAAYSSAPPSPTYKVAPEPVLYRKIEFGNSDAILLIEEKEFSVLKPHLDKLAKLLHEKFGYFEIGVYTISHIASVANSYEVFISRCPGWYLGKGRDLPSAIENIKFE